MTCSMALPFQFLHGFLHPLFLTIFSYSLLVMSKETGKWMQILNIISIYMTRYMKQVCPKMSYLTILLSQHLYLLIKIVYNSQQFKKIALKNYNFIGCSHLLFLSFIYYCCLWHSASYCWNHSFLGQIIFKRKRQCYKNQWVILNWVSSSTVKVKIANIKCTIWNRNLGHVILFLSHWQNGSLTPEPLQSFLIYFTQKNKQ